MKTCVRLAPLPTATAYAPLGAIGYCLMQTHFFDVLWRELSLPMKTVTHRPADKLLDVLLAVLSGCRAIAQVNTRLRPDHALAQAWGRPGFAEQASLARLLDQFDAGQVDKLRAGSEALFRRESATLRHPLATDWLWLDIDLTPLPCSPWAEGSTKGHLGKKTATAGSWPGCMRRSITKRCSHGSIRAGRKAVPAICPPWRHCSASWTSRQPSASAR
jgi:hypothetical protein